jgi:hypothetical protein
MEKNNFLQVLYPFQDKVLRIIEQLPVSFYLTGNTALCRGYLNHRYAQELNFCLNADINYEHQMSLIIDAFKFRNFNPELNFETQYLKKIIIRESDNYLQIEFLNDIQFRVGKSSINSLYKSIDNIDNILSNKVLLVENLDISDVVDIFYISLNHKFNWADVFRNAEQKNIWIDNKVVSESLENFQIDTLDEIYWIDTPPDKSTFSNYLKIICKDISELNSNSIYQIKL